MHCDVKNIYDVKYSAVWNQFGTNRIGAESDHCLVAYIYLTSMYIFTIIDLGKSAPQANKLSLLRDKVQNPLVLMFVSSLQMD